MVGNCLEFSFLKGFFRTFWPSTSASLLSLKSVHQLTDIKKYRITNLSQHPISSLAILDDEEEVEEDKK